MKTRLRLWVKIMLIIIFLVIFLLLYGFFVNNHGFKVNEIAIYDDIPLEYNGLKLVHISDINYGNTVHKNDLKRIVEKINLTKPDIVVFTGDLIYKDNKDNLDDMTKLLSNINYNIDAYFISGDEDNEAAEKILIDSGFTNLNDTYNLIYQSSNPILIAGISNNKNETEASLKLQNTMEYLKNNNVYSILLMHEPNNINLIDYNNFNLILAGHTLGGYIKIPTIGGLVLKKDNYSFGKDYYKKDNTNIYISNGLGNDNIKFRFFNKPSFNFYRIRKK